MKKLLGIIVLSLLLCGNANAKWGDEYMFKTKPGDENFSYNLSVATFNLFIDRYAEEGGSCEPAFSPSFFLDFADCSYVELKKIFRETIGNVDQGLADINYSYYKRLKNSARQVTAMLGKNISTEQINNKWNKDYINFSNEYFDELKYAFKNYLLPS
jgi:hypothetical protein